MQKKQILIPSIILIGVVVLLFIISLFFRKREIPIREMFQKEIAANLKEGYSIKDVIYESLDNQNKQIIAIIHFEEKDKIGQQDSLVVYELKDGKLADIYNTSEWILDLGNNLNGDDVTITDINKDGLKEFVITGSTGGNCWTCSYLRIFQVKGHRVLELLNDLPENYVIKGLKDLADDGSEEVLVVDAQWEFYMDLCHACSPGVTLVYKWEKDKYREDSKDFPSYYDENISELEQEIKDMSPDERGTDYYMGRAISIFLNYLEKGEKDKGWEVLKNYMSEENFKEKGFRDMAKAVMEDLRKGFFGGPTA
ncbi:MAG TPA: hypothetical protein VMT04_05940 [Terriglobales bacterium]|nr:hypothetical protein [Terriglobales bacterium]